MDRRNFLKGLLGVSLAGLFAGLYGAVVEPWWRLRVTRWSVQPQTWRRGQKLRIVMIADLHAAWPQMDIPRIRDVLNTAMAEKPDIIFLMGDYRATHRFQTRKVSIETVAPLLATLTAPLGVHAILGNHDWWDDKQAMARNGGRVHTEDVLKANGISVLRNRSVKISAPDGDFWLAGLDSQSAFHFWRPPIVVQADDLAGTMAQISDENPVILLAHEPDIFVQVESRIALTVSGHTHGGQVALMGWAPYVPSEYGNRFRYGHIQEGGRDLVVSGGLGCSGIPVRIGSPPEITVVDLS